MGFMKTTRIGSTAFLLMALAVTPAFADEGGGDLAAAVQNPVGSLISVPFKATLDFGAENGEVLVVNLQPVYPVRVGDWNIINRAIFPFIDIPKGLTTGIPEIPGGTAGSGATGLGDINYTPFLSPAVPKGFIWGIGPSITFPTATNDQLGSGKWSGGVSAVVLAQPKPWTVGFLARQLWSFAGKDDRQDVNQFLLQPFINYNISDGWYLISDMSWVANWDAPSDEQWTIPVGGGFGKLMKFGSQPVNMRIEYYYNVEKPKAAPDQSVSFTFQLLFPKK
jgi:hypothetical protein